MARPVTIRVFEHQLLKVGEEVDGLLFTEEYFQALAQWVQIRTCPYLQVEHQAIRFKSYVGVIQCGGLCIEILPKLDRWLPSTDAIQACLIEMLKVTRFLRVDTLKSAYISLKSLPLVDLFWQFFLEEVAKLLQEGLIRSYRTNEGWKPHLRGRLLLSQQLKASHQQTRFYTHSTIYDYNHPLNAVLYQALMVMRRLPLSPANHQLLGQVLKRFPKVDSSKQLLRQIDSIHLDWKSARYQDALFLAKLILKDNTPDVKSGRYEGVALVFDMNALFEAYIYRLLVRSKPEQAKISYQEQRFFWLKRSIRPDIVCEWKGKRVVMDTKWKLLPKGQPSMEDLRQMYVYNKYFRAAKGILVYPKLAFNESFSAPFHGVGAATDHGICEVLFLDIVREGRLNLGVGEAFWGSLG